MRSLLEEAEFLQSTGYLERSWSRVLLGFSCGGINQTRSLYLPRPALCCAI